MVDALEIYCQKFIEKSEENYKLYEFLSKEGKFLEWQIVAIFYSALCLAKAYLYKKGIPINSINSHDNVKFYLASEKNCKSLGVIKYYDVLYSYGREARYLNRRMSVNKLDTALKNYKIVKELLMKNY